VALKAANSFELQGNDHISSLIDVIKPAADFDWIPLVREVLGKKSTGRRETWSTDDAPRLIDVAKRAGRLNQSQLFGERSGIIKARSD
jgi:hypothetical protein